MTVKEQLLELIPEFNLIKSSELREKTMAVWIEALKCGGWNVSDLGEMPFTLLLKPCPANMIEHVRGVTGCAYEMGKKLKEIYGERLELDMDALVSGALLHDIGKLLEYKKEGEYKKSEYGSYIRHPFSGMALAYKFDLPAKVQHIIALHAKEGEGAKRCPEAIIVHYADFSNFEPFKK